MTEQYEPRLIWDAATGYDFFVSLHVLHAPDQFALRASWAKGVRTRLPADARAYFEETSHLLLSALPWVHDLPEPRNAAVVLEALKAIPAEKRFTTLMLSPEIPEEIILTLQSIAEQRAWDEADLALISKREETHKESKAEIRKMLDLWARSAELGSRTLEALTAYYEVFFEEEETRLLPALEEAVFRGQEMAQQLPFPELLAELSEGIRFEDDLLSYKEWVMVPSFWISPRILVSRLSRDQGVFFHGGRSAEASLVPGEAVPDSLFLTLKALADPTRLRILHYLQSQPQTPSELAKTLRLRAPTVIHHLNSLRLAGLVYVTYGKGDKRYAARTSRVAEMYLQLRRYLGVSEVKRREEISGRPPYIA